MCSIPHKIIKGKISLLDEFEQYYHCQQCRNLWWWWCAQHLSSTPSPWIFHTIVSRSCIEFSIHQTFLRDSDWYLWIKVLKLKVLSFIWYKCNFSSLITQTFNKLHVPKQNSYKYCLNYVSNHDNGQTFIMANLINF